MFILFRDILSHEFINLDLFFILCFYFGFKQLFSKSKIQSNTNKKKKKQHSYCLSYLLNGFYLLNLCESIVTILIRFELKCNHLASFVSRSISVVHSLSLSSSFSSRRHIRKNLITSQLNYAVRETQTHTHTHLTIDTQHKRTNCCYETTTTKKRHKTSRNYGNRLYTFQKLKGKWNIKWKECFYFFFFLLSFSIALFSLWILHLHLLVFVWIFTLYKYRSHGN